MMDELSLEAFHSVNHVARQAMVRAFYETVQDATADEVAVHFQAFHNSVAPAITHMKKRGELVKTGVTRETRCGRRASALRLVKS